MNDISSPAFSGPRYRQTVILILVVFGLAFSLTAIALLGRYALPSSDWVNAGPVADYPPSEAPYTFRKGDVGLIYIVNIRGDLLALSSRDPHPVGQTVLWRSLENRFIDPATGSNYWLDGSFDNHFYPNGPEPMDLERLPIKVEGEILWIDLAGIGR